MTMTFVDSNFNKEVLEFEGVCLVDFWATWCGPCRMQGPIVDSLAEKFKDNPNIKFGKLDVDENNEIATRYQIMSIPTLMIFKGGQVIETLVGLRTENEIEEKIAYYLNA